MTIASIPVHRFEDSAAYELFMGSWSRAACPVFLRWLAPPRQQRWLDVGCGTGILTENVATMCAPSSIVGVDPSPSQVEHAATLRQLSQAQFQVADAQALPFADASFDVVASALVINFIPDRSKALAEMHRVARRGGIVAGFVWDFAAERSPSWPLRQALHELGAQVPAVPGTEGSGREALHAMFQAAGFTSIDTLAFEVSVGFGDFNAFWRAQTPSYSPMTRIIAAMPDVQRSRLQQAVRARLPVLPDGRLGYSARANAIKASRPA